MIPRLSWSFTAGKAQKQCGVVDPNPTWNRIQHLVLWIRIRIMNQDPHMYINLGQIRGKIWKIEDKNSQLKDPTE